MPVLPPELFFLVYQYVDVVCPVYVSGMCLSETEGPPPWLGALSERSLEFGVSRLGYLI